MSNKFMPGAYTPAFEMEYKLDTGYEAKADPKDNYPTEEYILWIEKKLKKEFERGKINEL